MTVRVRGGNAAFPQRRGEVAALLKEAEERSGQLGALVGESEARATAAEQRCEQETARYETEVRSSRASSSSRRSYRFVLLSALFQPSVRDPSGNGPQSTAFLESDARLSRSFEEVRMLAADDSFFSE